jgi:hypothetical protein
MKKLPIAYVWREVEYVSDDGEIQRGFAQVPLARYHNLAASQFDEGEEYLLEEIEPRSMKSHRHFFVMVKEHFDQLPERLSERWPTPEHFRKWCLCETGWYDEKEFELASKRQAMALGTFIRTEDSFARIIIRDARVLVLKAKSQSLKAMGRKDFEASKKDVLALAEEFTGIPTSTMKREAGRHN